MEKSLGEKDLEELGFRLSSEVKKFQNGTTEWKGSIIIIIGMRRRPS
jgi:hypothetical protein